MRDVSLWRGLLGVEKTVIERVEFDEDAEMLVAHVRPSSGSVAGAGCAGGASLGMTRVRVGDAGGAWIWARSGRCWRPTRHEWSVATMGWWSLRCRGPVTMLAILGPSMIRWPGWRLSPRSRR